MAILRIAVLSDLHLDTVVEPASWDLSRAALKAAASSGADHVILAGDTFDCATAMLRDREKLQRQITSLGLWHRDRLTIVVGNHDVHHTPHRGSRLDRGRELARIPSADTSALLGTFSEWANLLSAPGDRLWKRAAFPLRKELDHVTLYAADTTHGDTLRSGEGFWCPRDDARLRAATLERAERRLLAMHHTPIAGNPMRIKSVIRGIVPLGFPPESLAPLTRFVEDAAVDAIVCGHLHKTANYEREVGARRTPAYIVGRTGGLHGAASMFGMLSVPVRGRITWETRAV